MSRITAFLIAIAAFTACRPAAAPVSVSNAPVSINERRTTNAPMPPSKPFTEMSWTLADERVQKLSDHNGKVVVLDFWATYCEPCKRMIPHLNSLVARYGRERIQVVGLNVGGEEDRVKIPAFTAATRIDYDIAYPEDALSSFIFAERSDIPQTAVFDKKGALIRKIVGFNDSIQKELDEAIERAVNTN